MNQEQANEFAAEWVAAWNAHDIERILAHYSEDFEMNSLVIARRTGIASGTLKGKDKVREYWLGAFREYPDLRFELLNVLLGVSWLTLYYIGARGSKVAETFIFNEVGEVVRAFSSYA
ncbi:MAG: nuclear transport factor 2 family protein [Alcanivorax sp.]|nr:nuclear transport factor 2 family protein [Alcanivorax sp.]